ncbi:hypothetical protein [Mesomycoplasma hyopneumoniae]|uniref:Uncharacterized protein n=3 Tax=Mesomycoplasma hyopneumoniae TaxID=2099 RepID=Q4A8L5_MESH7|nr:hypothetical protein [Mesomycoplasma hyopneumoniae]AAV27773.1 hypothetical protein mhp232 [Mesomycoplasma hyopneumoniae 232]AAZ53524.2 hypothetical protein MHP7448_0685 [Mesomycoplasma hyopneumoniae 7448]AGQ50782.1 hypothetical protein MHL_2765 [Mesomycoplasma hyopneumoniae 7422]ASU14303.1 hypothetical protein CIB43_00407 [Mesomycoplasma hyopneumoniae]UIF67179.1 hypothetical protein KUD10_00830 [Mesomycoplasma hyopneumoniae]
MSRFTRFFSTVLAVIIGNVLLFGIIIATLYFLFKKQIENFKFDKITKTINEIQEAVGKLDSAQIKKFQEGLNKFTSLDFDALKNQFESVKTIPSKLDQILKQLQEISESLKKVQNGSVSQAAHALVNTSIFEFINRVKFL